MARSAVRAAGVGAGAAPDAVARAAEDAPGVDAPGADARCRVMCRAEQQWGMDHNLIPHVFGNAVYGDIVGFIVENKGLAFQKRQNSLSRML